MICACQPELCECVAEKNEMRRERGRRHCRFLSFFYLIHILRRFFQTLTLSLPSASPPEQILFDRGSRLKAKQRESERERECKGTNLKTREKIFYSLPPHFFLFPLTHSLTHFLSLSSFYVYRLTHSVGAHPVNSAPFKCLYVSLISLGDPRVHTHPQS